MIFAKKENIKFFRVKLNHRPVRIFGRIALMMTRRMGTGSVLLQASSLSGCCQCGVSSWLLILTADSGNPGRSRVHFIMAVAGVALWSARAAIRLNND